MPALALVFVTALAGCQKVQERPPVAPAPPPASSAPARLPQAAVPAPPPGPAVAKTARVRIGLLLPLTGPEAGIGRAMLDAAELALFDSDNKDVALLPFDTASTPEGAATAARAALGHQVGIIVGPVTAGATRQVAAAAVTHDIDVLSFSSDSGVAGGNVYTLGFTPAEQIDRVISYARSQGLTRFAALLPDNPYGSVIATALKAALGKDGGTLTKLVTYPADQPDFNAAVAELAGHGPLKAGSGSPHADQALAEEDARLTPPFQALLLAEGGARLKALAPLLPYYAIDPGKVRFLGTGLWDVPGLGKEPELVGGWYAGSPPADTAAFARRFTKAFGKTPPRIASLGYDGVALAAALAKNPDPEPFSKAALGTEDGFSGFDGIFRFGATNVAERGLAILEITADGVKVVQPAPQSFQPVTN